MLSKNITAIYLFVLQTIRGFYFIVSYLLLQGKWFYRGSREVKGERIFLVRLIISFTLIKDVLIMDP